MFYDVEIYNDSGSTYRWQNGTDIFNFESEIPIFDQAKNLAFKYSGLTGEMSDFKFRVKALTPLYDLPPKKYPIRRSLKKIN